MIETLSKFILFQLNYVPMCTGTSNNNVFVKTFSKVNARNAVDDNWKGDPVNHRPNTEHNLIFFQ